MTREQKIFEARRLRARGLTSPQIAERLDANKSTVRNWYLGGVCPCGAPLDGGNGSGSSQRCPNCVPAASTYWTAEKLIERIQEWARLYGEPPTAEDWSPAQAAYRRAADASVVHKRFYDGDWPGSNTTRQRFGTWNAAIQAAGFAPLSVGQYREERAGVAA